MLAWDINGAKETEVGYVLARDYWGKGLATEAARACRDYGFERLGFDRLISVIQPGNVASQHVAMKNAMRYERDELINGIGARIYSIERSVGQRSKQAVKFADFAGYFARRGEAHGMLFGRFRLCGLCRLSISRGVTIPRT